MTEKYFVASNTDTPEKLFFSEDLARESKITYIDSFDEKGNHVRSYQYAEINGKWQYTTNF